MFTREQIKGFWDKCVLVKTNQAMNAAGEIVHLKPEYDKVQAATNVPWYVIGAIDMREETFNHKCYLGNGQLLTKKTTIVPKGRGPFKNWYEGAIDSIHISGWDRLPQGRHWDVVTCLMKCESYNGAGYAHQGIRSPYVWAGTSMQEKGKYTSDGHFDPSAWDGQLGCAAVFLALRNFHGVVIE